jgi:ATP-dependent Clp endopeptidase proteolytic subunit ClpP
MTVDLNQLRARAADYAARRAQSAKDSSYVRAAVRAANDQRSGEIEIFGEIDEFWGVGPKAVAAALAELGDVSEIFLKINSPGGWVFDGLAIFNLLKQHPANVTATVFGQAASAASVIAMAGDKIVMAEGAMMMIHRAWGVALGNAEDMLELAAVLDKVDGELAGIYARRTENEVKQVLAWMEKETYFTGAEAVEAGFADETIGGEAKDGKEDKENKAAAPGPGFRALNAARLRLAGVQQALA